MADIKTEERLQRLESRSEAVRRDVTDIDRRLRRLEELSVPVQAERAASTLDAEDLRAFDHARPVDRRGWRDVYLTAANIIQVMDGAEWQGNKVKIRAEPGLREKLRKYFVGED